MLTMSHLRDCDLTVTTQVAVMEPSGGLINLLIERKEHFFTVSERQASSLITVQRADNHLVFGQIE